MSWDVINNFGVNLISAYELDNCSNLNGFYELLNPDEIYDFVKDKNGLDCFIINVSSLIKEFFPMAKIYLEFHCDPEIPNLDSLFAFIYNESNSDLENEKRFNEFLCKYYKFCEDFDKLKRFLVVDLIEDNGDFF